VREEKVLINGILEECGEELRNKNEKAAREFW